MHLDGAWREVQLRQSKIKSAWLSVNSFLLIAFD